MSQFFEYDSVSGIRTDTDWNPTTGEMTVIRTADVESALDHAKAHANAAGKNVQGIRESWWHYCTIPPIVQLRLLAKGIDITRSEHMERALTEINENYPDLKMVDAMEGPRAQRKIFY
jgi:hypothetical protein